MDRLFLMPRRGPTPVPATIAGAERVEIPVADGERLVGWWLPPHGGTAAGPAPAVLHVHGNAGNIENHVDASAPLTAEGIGVLVFDYRGFGESTGRAGPRSRLLADARAALDHLLARPDVDPDRVGLFGQSLGGSVGLVLMAERVELRAGVLISPFASWRWIAADAVSPATRAGPVARLVAGLLVRDTLRPDEAATGIDRPLLIVHGDADRIVPLHHGEAVAAAAPNAELAIIAGGDHNGMLFTHPEAMERIAAFLRRELEVE